MILPGSSVFQRASLSIWLLFNSAQLIINEQKEWRTLPVFIHQPPPPAALLLLPFLLYRRKPFCVSQAWCVKRRWRDNFLLYLFIYILFIYLFDCLFVLKHRMCVLYSRALRFCLIGVKSLFVCALPRRESSYCACHCGPRRRCTNLSCCFTLRLL